MSALIKSAPLKDQLSRTLPYGIQIVSDVHLEFRKQAPVITPNASCLALLGDIGQPFEPSYKDFIGTQAENFSKVFLIMGNHEYYSSTGTTTDAILEKARQVCAGYENVHLLDRSRVDLDERVSVLGCTLWSLLNAKSATFLNDMRKIHIPDGENRLLDRETYNSWHIRDVIWLQRELKQVATDGRKAIVLTHHGPLLDMSGKFKGSRASSAFVSDLRHLFTPPAIAFASGHVHSNVDVEINGIRSVSNALGYPGEVTGYKEDVVIPLQ
jgi:predicted phosphohydrolase